MLNTDTSLERQQSELTAALVGERADRQRAILTSLGSLIPGVELTGGSGAPDAFDNAVLHHAFQQAQLAARTQDAARALRAVRLWQQRDALRARAVQTAVGPVLVVDAADCTPVEDDRLGSRMYLLDEPTGSGAAADRGTAEVLNAAVDAALATGSEVLRSSTAIVVWTRSIALHEVSHSHTLDFLPGTVVLDWSDQPLRLGETLVHEATHSWLNEAFAAEGVEFAENGPSFHSPWRNEERPAFGIVHAALAFATVIHYLRRIQPDSEDASPLAAVLRQRLSVELQSLEIGHQAALECFEQVSSERLRSYLHDAVEAALKPA